MKLQTAALIAASFLSSTAFAQTPQCDALDDKAASIAKKVMASAYLYDCCDETIAKCLTKTPVCSLAPRLADEVCRLASAKKSEQDIIHTLEQRAMAMSDVAAVSKIAVKPEHIWGNPDAKIVISVYLCARCPYCSKHVPALMEAIEKAGLKDKIALNLRLFPIKSHVNSTPAAVAVEAAAQMGKGWPYLLKIYDKFDGFGLADIPAFAAELGLDAEKFDALVKEKSIRDEVVSAKKEGLINAVESTPTFFINGRRIQGIFDKASMISMIEEALEK